MAALRAGGWGGNFTVFADEVMDNTRAAADRSESRTHTFIQPFDIFTRGNI